MKEEVISSPSPEQCLAEGYGLLHRNLGKLAVSPLAEASRLFSESDEAKTAEAVHGVGLGNHIERQTMPTMESLEASLLMYEELGDQMAMGAVYRDIGTAYDSYNQPDYAQLWLGKSVKLLESLPPEDTSYTLNDYANNLGLSLSTLGLIMAKNGQLNEGRDLAEKGLAIICTGQGKWCTQAKACTQLSRITLMQGDLAKTYKTLNLASTAFLTDEIRMKRIEEQRRLYAIFEGLRAYALIRYNHQSEDFIDITARLYYERAKLALEDPRMTNKALNAVREIIHADEIEDRLAA